MFFSHVQVEEEGIIKKMLQSKIRYVIITDKCKCYERDSILIQANREEAPPTESASMDRQKKGTLLSRLVEIYSRHVRNTR